MSEDTLESLLDRLEEMLVRKTGQWHETSIPIGGRSEDSRHNAALAFAAVDALPTLIAIARGYDTSKDDGVRE